MGHIVWIASYPKSGNTWVRAFLHEILRKDSGAFDLDRMAETAGNEASIGNYRAIDPRPWSRWTPADVGRARPTAQAAFAQRHRHLVFCKTHLAVLRSCGRSTINMDVTAGAVYIVRNPLDIAPSYADHQGLPLDVAIDLMNLDDHQTPSTETHVSELVGSWSQNVETWTRRRIPGLHVMRYEDMMTSPVATFCELAVFLRLKAPRRRIKEAVRTTSFVNLRRLEDQKGFGERSLPQKRFFRQGRVGTWRSELASRQIRKIAEGNEAMMRTFGYWKDVSE